jgi:carboxylesterase type B
MKLFATSLLLLGLALGSSFAAIIEIEDGLIEGTIMVSRKGVSFHAFLKIPFAKAPVGELRFQPPVRNDVWEGVFNATAYGPTCVQSISIGSFGQSEDCLHLYVYTRDLTPNTLKPVIVFIHGGVSDDINRAAAVAQ